MVISFYIGKIPQTNIDCCCSREFLSDCNGNYGTTLPFEVEYTNIIVELDTVMELTFSGVCVYF